MDLYTFKGSRFCKAKKAISRLETNLTKTESKKKEVNWQDTGEKDEYSRFKL